jgi:hypothetical protein
VDGTWEQNHNDQLIIYKCTGLSTVVKQIIFEDSLTFTGLESCMCCEIIAVFVIYMSYTSRFTLVRITKFKLNAADMR